MHTQQDAQDAVERFVWQWAVHLLNAKIITPENDCSPLFAGLIIRSVWRLDLTKDLV